MAAAYDMGNYEMKYSDNVNNNNNNSTDSEPSTPMTMSDGDYDFPSNTNSNNRRKWLYWGAGAALLLIGVAVGAGIGATSSKSNSSPVQSSNNNNPSNPNPTNGGGTAQDPFAPAGNVIVHETLTKVSLQGGSELEENGSYQQLAFHFVDNTYQEGLHDEKRILQRFVLASIFYATNQVESEYTLIRFQGLGIQPWGDTTGWLSDPDECQWMGIVCDSEGYVTELNLAGNSLTGTFPAETKLLSRLIVLDLEGNHCFNSGPENNDWIGDITTLQYLYLKKVAFHYRPGIPTSFNKLTNLKEVDLSYTAYRGELDPNLFANFNDLVILNMGGNSYNSSFPMSLGRLPKLAYMYSSYTDLTGDVSFFQGPDQWPSLVEVWMDHNPKLTGTLPSNIGSYSNLVSFSFVECDLFGPLPESLGDLAGLKKAWLYGNRLSGPIPSSIGGLGNVEYFQVEDNQLTGTIPDTMKLLSLKMQNLHADCQAGGPVVCNECTCCGPQCKDEPLRRR